jgi:Cytochrome P460
MPMPRVLNFLLPVLPVLLMGAAANPEAPHYNAKGEFILPANYREWVYLSSGLDMNYAEGAAAPDHHMFDNVWVDPVSWHQFQKTGHWPDKTVFAREDRAATSKGSINKSGMFQTEDLMGLEFHIRDEARFKGGWGFFFTAGTAPAQFIPYAAGCYACHQTHGAVDTTFVQFYPTAKPVAVKAGTYKDQE